MGRAQGQVDLGHFCRLQDLLDSKTLFLQSDDAWAVSPVNPYTPPYTSVLISEKPFCIRYANEHPLWCQLKGL